MLEIIKFNALIFRRSRVKYFVSLALQYISFSHKVAMKIDSP
jgi:hypothetical protein